MSLFGRNWLKRIKLDWQIIKSFRINSPLDEVIDKHYRLFTSELGKLKGMEAKICVPSNAQFNSLIGPPQLYQLSCQMGVYVFVEIIR